MYYTYVYSQHENANVCMCSIHACLYNLMYILATVSLSSKFKAYDSINFYFEIEEYSLFKIPGVKY